MSFSGLSPHTEIAVLYLARKAEGITPLQTFINSYLKHPPGIEHSLVVLFKGFDGEDDLKQTRAVFSQVPHISIQLTDEGFDLGSYLKASKNLNHEYVCCFNTFSKILEDDWLKKFYSHASFPDVGIVGATGSYEAICDSMALIQKVIWLDSQAEIEAKLRFRIRKYFEFIFQMVSPQKTGKIPLIYQAKRAVRKSVLIARYLIRCCKQWKQPQDLEQRYISWWAQAQKQGDLAKFCTFPTFPNPHIRSNAFMIKRDRFLSLNHNFFMTKIDACLFESGYNSMTQQILKNGLKARIIGKNGIGYDVEKWPYSGTFRLGSQENLLISDNQTNFFAAANHETRLSHTWMTWGSEELSLPKDFPNLEIKLHRSAITNPTGSKFNA